MQHYAHTLFSIFASSILCFAMSACGGGAGGGSSTPPPSNPAIVITTTTLANATTGVAYSTTLSATGGTGTGYSWSLSSGTLPTGFSLSTSGTLSSTGSPLASAGSYSFTVKVTDSGGDSATASMTLVVNAPAALTIETSSLASATCGRPYSVALTAAGGTGTGYTWSLLSGALPLGFTFSSRGTLSSTGNPVDLPGSYTFSVQVADSGGDSATQSFTLAVQQQANPALQITSLSLPNATVGQPYSTTLTAIGGSGTGYSWTAPGFFGPLPASFSLSASGVLSASSVDTQTENYAFPVQVTDSAGNTATVPLGLVVQPPTPITVNNILTDLHDFGGTIINANGNSGLDGSYPLAGVTFDRSGNMYGTTFGGGANVSYGDWDPKLGYEVYGGTVWKISPSGAYTDIHDFTGCTSYPCSSTITNANGTSGPDGWGPSAAVIFDNEGNTYGTATYGGAYYSPTNIAGKGIVWELTTQGAYKDLHDFGGTVINANGKSGPDGQNPLSSIVFDSNGDMYGTASAGGPNNAGLVWEITASGTYQDIHDFGGTITTANGSAGADGANPHAGVTFDASGNMYGTTMNGGANKAGIVWEIMPSGLYKDLHDFGGTAINANGSSGPDGANLWAGATLDASGNLYGTTIVGGPNNNAGMVWEITSSGAYEDLHDFGGTVTNADGSAGPDGISPASAGVTLDKSANLYGTTLIGGQSEGEYANTAFGGGGVVWEITASKKYLDLYDFGASQGPDLSPLATGGGEGYWPLGGVALDSSGNIYGTASGFYMAGAPLNMMVWELSPATKNLPPPSIAPGGIVPVGSGCTAATLTAVPGEWVSIYGSNLAGTTAAWNGTSPNLPASSLFWNGNFPQSLGGTSVTINGVGAFLSFVSPSQIIFQVPVDIIIEGVAGTGEATGPLPVVVTTSSGTAESAISISTFGVPSLLMIDAEHVAGIILRSDGSGKYDGGKYDIIGPTGDSLGFPTVAAKAGDNIEIFSVGLGPTTAGLAWQGSADTLGNPMTLTINGTAVVSADPINSQEVSLAGSGLFVFNFTLPSGLGTGDVPISATTGVAGLGAVPSSPNVVISLQ